MNGAKKTLIVTADDFGIGHEQNLAIDYAMKNNIATQASLVVNSAYTREAVEMARAGGYADKLCLHLTITTGEPLSESIKKAGLYYKDGKFVFRRHQGRRTLLMPQYVQ